MQLARKSYVASAVVLHRVDEMQLARKSYVVSRVLLNQFERDRVDRAAFDERIFLAVGIGCC